MADKKGPKYEIVCPTQCSLHPDTIGAAAAAALLAIREGGAGAPTFARRAAEILGRPVAETSASRHLKHYREKAPDAAEEPADGAKVSDLEILNRIIAAGARNAKNWKPTIGDTLKAMDMKLRLTGNSVFDDMLAAMNVGLDLADAEEEAAVVENPEAIDGGDV